MILDLRVDRPEKFPLVTTHVDGEEVGVLWLERSVDGGRAQYYPVCADGGADLMERHTEMCERTSSSTHGREKTRT